MKKNLNVQNLPAGRWSCRSAEWSSPSPSGRFLSGRWSRNLCRTSACPTTARRDNKCKQELVCRIGVRSYNHSTQRECAFHLAEEVSLLLPRGEAGQVAADHQVGVVQNRVEPTPGGQQSLDAQDNMFIVQHYWTLNLSWVCVGFSPAGFLFSHFLIQGEPRCSCTADLKLIISHTVWLDSPSPLSLCY